MPDQKGTGKHPHKSTEEPYPHTKESNESGREEESKKSSGGKTKSAGAGGGESSDLKEREYRDSEGNIHHHTRTSEVERNKRKE